MPIILVENLKDKIDLKTDDWHNREGTNCLAFALGLDIHSDFLINEYIEYAYNLGCLHQIRYNKCTMQDQIVYNNLTNIEKLELDLQATELFYEEIELYDKIIDSNEWKIAFFENKLMRDVHFYRQTENNGIWYHKPGKYNKPRCYVNGAIITDPIAAAKEEYDGYIYQRTYRLRK